MKVAVYESINLKDPKAGLIGYGTDEGYVEITSVLSLEEYRKLKKESLSKSLQSFGLPNKGIFFEQAFEKAWNNPTINSPLTRKIRMDDGTIKYGYQVHVKYVCEKCHSENVRQQTPEEQETECAEDGTLDSFYEFGFMSVSICQDCGHREVDI